MIRKISLGLDYKTAMHYTVGQRFGRNTIHGILQKEDGWHIWIETDEGEVVRWKHISLNSAVTVEYDINGF